MLQGKTLIIPLSPIEINDIGGKDNPVSIGKALDIFLSKVLTETLKSGKDIIPGDLTKEIQNTLSGAVDIITKGSSEIKEGVEGAVKGITDIFK